MNTLFYRCHNFGMAFGTFPMGRKTSSVGYEVRVKINIRGSNFFRLESVVFWGPYYV
jgi:hypothetical protein